MVEFMSECTYFLASRRAYLVQYCRGRVSNFNQSEAIETVLSLLIGLNLGAFPKNTVLDCTSRARVLVQE